MLEIWKETGSDGEKKNDGETKEVSVSVSQLYMMRLGLNFSGEGYRALHSSGLSLGCIEGVSPAFLLAFVGEPLSPIFPESCFFFCPRLKNSHFVSDIAVLHSGLG